MSIDVQAGGGYRIASFTDYGDAEAVVDTLADNGFPVEHVRVIGHDLRVVENVTGRRTYATAATGGLLSGAVIGAAFGFVFGLFSWIEPLESAVLLALYGVVLGGLVGGVIGFVAYWMSAGRRDFVSVQSVTAGRYDVVTDSEESAEQAGLVLRHEKPVR